MTDLISTESAKRSGENLEERVREVTDTLAGLIVSANKQAVELEKTYDPGPDPYEKLEIVSVRQQWNNSTRPKPIDYPDDRLSAISSSAARRMFFSLGH